MDFTEIDVRALREKIYRLKSKLNLGSVKGRVMTSRIRQPRFNVANSLIFGVAHKFSEKRPCLLLPIDHHTMTITAPGLSKQLPLQNTLKTRCVKHWASVGNFGLWPYLIVPSVNGMGGSRNFL